MYNRTDFETNNFLTFNRNINKHGNVKENENIKDDAFNIILANIST